MATTVLLISKNENLHHQIESKLNGFHVFVNRNESFDLNQLTNSFGILWDIASVPLPPQRVIISLIRTKTPGPILLLANEHSLAPQPVLSKKVFLTYHFDDLIAKDDPSEICFRLIQNIWAYQRTEQISSNPHHDKSLTTRHIRIDLDTFEVTAFDKQVKLSPIEYKLLLFFISNADVVLTRIQIAAHVWENTSSATLRIIDTHISKLRKKIELDQKHPQIIKTVRSFGYMFSD
ncbi:winged helix-turn-helix domain-containing protein [Lentilactobacillus sp. Marseille-Q4993]|uniref:winged helix-turn-helix domain-containing protein n=1 Tax=Lentilactobacillus sp. Marseille-Q4993 TaxID=3039492 RepID=UPI0024BC6C1F|nr:winged helix-turn-helix domain-containing protein [Lentilactobacillus sp. Marseille-Q4993]